MSDETGISLFFLNMQAAEKVAKLFIRCFELFPVPIRDQSFLQRLVRAQLFVGIVGGSVLELIWSGAWQGLPQLLLQPSQFALFSGLLVIPNLLFGFWWAVSEHVIIWVIVRREQRLKQRGSSETT